MSLQFFLKMNSPTLKAISAKGHCKSASHLQYGVPIFSGNSSPSRLLHSVCNNNLLFTAPQ